MQSVLVLHGITHWPLVLLFPSLAFMDILEQLIPFITKTETIVLCSDDHARRWEKIKSSSALKLGYRAFAERQVR